MTGRPPVTTDRPLPQQRQEVADDRIVGLDRGPHGNCSEELAVRESGAGAGFPILCRGGVNFDEGDADVQTRGRRKVQPMKVCLVSRTCLCLARWSANSAGTGWNNTSGSGSGPQVEIPTRSRSEGTR